jgi:hypothetical protein
VSEIRLHEGTDPNAETRRIDTHEKALAELLDKRFTWRDLVATAFLLTWAAAALRELGVLG